MSTFAVNTVEGKKLYIQKGIFAVNTVAWSHNGKYLASGSNNAIVQLWDLSQDSPFYTYSGHKDRVYSVTWSPHDQRIASGSGDATVQVWQFRYA